MNLDIALIRADGGTQSRAQLDPATVEAYTEAMRAGGDTFPALIVYYDGEHYWLADGFHRLAAALAAGRTQIAVDVRQGTRRDAILHAVSANAQHGLRRTNADKRRAVQTLLADTEWGQWSDSEIARRCNVDHKTVSAMRVSLGVLQVRKPSLAESASENIPNVADMRVSLTWEFPSEDIPNTSSLSSDDSEEILNADQRLYTTRHGTVATMRTANIGGQAQTWAPIWQLQHVVQDWLTAQTADAAAQITLLTAIRDRTCTGLIALDELLHSEPLQALAPWRKNDLLQAVNNLLAMVRQPASPRAAANEPALPVAAFAAVETGVAAWLQADYPNAGCDVLQAISEQSAAGLAAMLTLSQSGYLPTNWRTSDIPVACLNLLAATGAAHPRLAATDSGAVVIHHGDSRQLTRYVAPGTAQLVITSPPYNVGIAYGAHDDNLPDTQYKALLWDVFAQCYAALAPGGRIAVVVPHGVGRNPWRPLAASVVDILTRQEFTLRGLITWEKGVTGNRTTWGSWESSSNPALRDRTEAIVIAHKGPPELPIPQPLPATWLPGELFMALTQDLWPLAPESAQRIGHPAPFPVELAARLIRLYAYPGAHIVDPFSGSGTVGVAAQQLGCRATLVDVDADYCQLAAQRCQGDTKGENS